MSTSPPGVVDLSPETSAPGPVLFEKFGFTVENVIARVRELLHLAADTRTYQIVYGPSAQGGNRIPMVTRSVLAILTNIGAQIQVPDSAVKAGATKPTVGLIGGETRPIIIVHQGPKAPADAYVAIDYADTTYWVERDDFDSKYAFTVLQNLMALAQADTSSKAPVVTIPANQHASL